MSDGVVALIQDKQDHYLMIQDSGGDYEGKWAPVHGAVEGTDESIKEAVVRETKEEIGLNVEPVEKVAETDADYKVERLHWYTTEILGGEIETNEEVAAHGYFELEEILSDDLELLPTTEEFFDNYKEKLS